MNIFCYPHHISDFRRDTDHLTHEQRGVYRAVLDAYYFNAGNLTANIEQLSRIISVHTDSERAALAHAVGNFFTQVNGNLMQKRADAEIAKIRDKSAKAAANAKLKHLKDKGNIPCERTADAEPPHSERTADALLTKNQEPSIRDIEIRRADFEEFWQVYPRNVAKQSALNAYTKARKGGTEHEAVITGTRRYADECRGKEQRFIAHPATWLNAGRWEDAPGANRDSVDGGKPNGNARANRQEPKSRAGLVAELIRELPENERQPQGIWVSEDTGHP